MSSDFNGKIIVDAKIERELVYHAANGISKEELLRKVKYDLKLLADFVTLDDFDIVECESRGTSL